MGDKTPKDFSIIERGLVVEGSVSFRGRLLVKGVLKGVLEGETVIIAPGGAVYSDAKVDRMTIGGVYEGNIAVGEELIVLSTGKCGGRVVCKNLELEAGGALNAEVSCTKPQDKNPPAISIPSMD